MLIKGKDLNPTQRATVKAAYVHRHTVEHNASWSKDKATQTDKQWIDSHAFYFVKDGSRLAANRKYCIPVYMAE